MVYSEAKRKRGDWRFSTPALLWFLACLALLISIAALVIRPGEPRIAVIRSDDLVFQYTGMEEAQGRYKIKHDAWVAEIDSLSGVFREKIEVFDKEKDNLSRNARADREEELRLMRRTIEQRQEDLTQMATDEDRALTEGVLNQINKFVEEYGRTHGYDVILGSGASGNVLYVNHLFDITEEVLQELNESYRIADSE